MPRRFLTAAVAASLFAFPALAADGPIVVEDPYARAATPSAKSGAAFMLILNRGTEDDRLLAVASDAAQRVELHSNVDDDSGVMRMVELEDGIPVPAGGSAELKRGGDHVMFMGLTRPFLQGETLEVTLTFETAGEIAVEIPVDLEREPEAGGHGAMTHGGATN
jgi:periplasmic copper chaperone A